MRPSAHSRHVGIWRTIGDTLGLTVPDAGAIAAAAELGTASQLPAVSGDVAQVQDMGTEVAQAFGINTSTSTINRRQAMRVPAFARGRNTICGTIGTLDLFAVKGSTRDDQRELLVQTDENATRQYTLTWTVDDLLCHGIAWWRVTDRDAQGYPKHAEWVQRSRVTVDQDKGTIRVDGSTVDVDDMIRFDGPHEGVLAYGGDVLLAALALERAVKRYADKPSPNTVLYDKRPMDAPGRDLKDQEIDDLVESWVTSPTDSPVRYLNRYLGAEAFGWDPQKLDLTAARQQAAVQVARLLGMPSRQVNAPSESSLNYSTTVMDRQELVDGPLAMYLTALEQRLSMPDVTPRGWRVRFDRDGFTKGTTKDRLENARTFVDAGLGPRSEARVRYLDLPPEPDAKTFPPDPQPPTPPPAPPADPQE